MRQVTDKKRSTRGPISIPERVDHAITGKDADATVPMKKRPATNQELRQAAWVKKQEDGRKQHAEANRARVRAGKKKKPDPYVTDVPSIWEKMAERRLYAQLREVGDTTKNIDKYQRNRVLSSLFLVGVGGAAGYLLHPWLYLGGLIIAVIFYMMRLKRVDNFYRAWKFQRQLNFSKFTRLVIPYLKASGGNAALYAIFNKILQRTENEDDRRSLYQLMGEMGDNPTSIQPFVDYAQRSSGTDMSHLFMTTVFDFQQSTFDVSVIDELGQIAADDMMSAIDEIIDMKLKRFALFPTKVVMSSFILVAGLGVGILLNNLQEINFSGGILDPTTSLDEATSEVEGADAHPRSKQADGEVDAVNK